MPNLIPHDIREWMRTMEFKISDLTRRLDPIRAAYFDVPGGFDTGWQEITSWDPDFAPQAGSETPVARRWGPMVSVKGRANTTVATVSGSAVYTLPEGFGFEPSTIHEAGRSLIPGSGNFAHRYYITPGGVGSQQGVGALGIAANSLVTLHASWMVDLP